MAGYYKEAMDTRPSAVAIICDPRYKLDLLDFIYTADGGINAPMYKKSKASNMSTANINGGQLESQNLTGRRLRIMLLMLKRVNHLQLKRKRMDKKIGGLIHSMALQII
jgi:hypothetical protein